MLVYCPRSDAINWTRRYFEAHQGVVPIGLALRAFGIPTFVHAYRDVAVELETVSLQTAFTPRAEAALHLTWRAAHGGPFPALTGVMTARAHSTHATLHFMGSYAPPFGIAGRFFDALVGRHIARISVRMLLCDIKRYIEQINIEEHVAGSFAAFEANARSPGGPDLSGVPVHGNVAIRRDGSYLACSITLEGDAPHIPQLVPGEYTLSAQRVETLLAELAKPDLRIAPVNALNSK